MKSEVCSPKRFFQKIKKTIIVLMVTVISHVPNIALAEVVFENQQSLMPTQAALVEMTRAESQFRMNQYLQNEELKQKLALNGFSQSEIQTRLNALSDHELNALVQQMDQMQYGGDILITVLLIVLIIFLVKRI